MSSKKRNTHVEEPSRLDLLLAQVEKHGKSDYIGAVHALSVRLPTITHASVEALCKHSGMSRNKMICQLLEVALEQVFEGLSEEDYQAVDALRSETIMEILKETDPEQAAQGDC